MKKKLLTKAQIDRAYQKQREAQKRANLKKLAKVASPEYRAQQIAKQKKTNEKNLLKISSQDYRDKQREKQKAQIAKQFNNDKLKAEERRNNPPSCTLKRSKLPTQEKPIKSKGTHGRTRAAFEVELHDKMAAIGCIACINAGLSFEGEGSYVSIHHVNGRTSKQCHEEGFPSCMWHHDTPMTEEDAKKYPSVFPIHAKGSLGGKVPWEKINGSRNSLILQVWEMIGYKPKYSKISEELSNAVNVA